MVGNRFEYRWKLDDCLMLMLLCLYPRFQNKPSSSESPFNGSFSLSEVSPSNPSKPLQTYQTRHLPSSLLLQTSGSPTLHQPLDFSPWLLYSTPSLCVHISCVEPLPSSSFPPSSSSHQ